MGRKLQDLSGQIFNGLQFLSVHSKGAGKAIKWAVLCHCGNSFVTTASRVKSGKTKSCGCQRYHYKFIDDRKTYNSYNAMRGRCTNVRSKNYPKYGGAGITVCDRWLEKSHGYTNFVADMGYRPEGCTINRIDGAKIYSKETCEWANLTDQAFNQKTRKDSPSGISGVKYRKDRDKWTSYITVDGNTSILYYGDSESDAILAREQAELQIFGYNKLNKGGM